MKPWLPCLLLSLTTLTACSHQTLSHPNTNTFHTSLHSSQMMQHLQALQDIANQHGGNRAVGSQGGEASAKYILDAAKKSGFNMQQLPFKNRDGVLGNNIIVEIQGQSNKEAIIIGAHYDSVSTGPGINDNGSGVALLLTLMQQYQQQNTPPKHNIYLAFWDSEEVGLGGSQHFVSNLSQTQLKGIKAYINVDMVGTPNPDILIADTDKSSLAEIEKTAKENGVAQKDYQPILDALNSIPSHPGDLALENSLKGFFKAKNLTIREDTATLTASDTLPFLGKVPVTSIILFNEQMKGNVLEFALCYHQACDTIDKVDPKSLQLAADAVLHLIDELEE